MLNDTKVVRYMHTDGHMHRAQGGGGAAAAGARKQV